MVVSETVVGSGAYTYEVHEDWAQVPEGWEMPAAAVTVDSQDRVYCFNRSKEHPIIVFDRDGNVPARPGARASSPSRTPSASTSTTTSGRSTATHGQALLFTRDGQAPARDRDARLPLGHRRRAGATTSSQACEDGDPRRRAVQPADGHRADAHPARCSSPTATATPASTSSPPTARTSSPGASRAPSPVSSTCRTASGSTGAGACWCADRENDRVQIFDQEGKLLEIWPTELIGPAFFYVDADDIVYIPEHNGGLVSVLTLDGERLARWGDPSFRSCHGIWGDSHGDIYVVRPGALGTAPPDRQIRPPVRPLTP